MSYSFSKVFLRIVYVALGSVLILFSCGEGPSSNGNIPCNFKGKQCDDGRKETVSDVYNDSCKCVGKLYKKPTVSQGSGVMDAEGNTYSSVIVNGQEWMRQNLRVKKYRNGDPIASGLDDVQWNNTEKGACSFQTEKSDDNFDFGGYYNWFATKDPRGLCPTGWHVPSGQEWLVLEESLGGESVAGKKMTTTSGWFNYSEEFDLTNESQFSGLPGGYVIGGEIEQQGYEANWWSNSEYDESFRGKVEISHSYSFKLDSNDSTLKHIKKHKHYGLNVRCVKD